MESLRDKLIRKGFLKIPDSNLNAIPGGNLEFRGHTLSTITGGPGDKSGNLQKTSVNTRPIEADQSISRKSVTHFSN